MRLEDLERLDREILAAAHRVVPMIDVHRGDRSAWTVALRHDVDDNDGSLENALAFGKWEEERGYRSTFFLLHSARYWPDAVEAARELEARGHEIGIHVNAIATALRTGRPPELILREAIHDLLRGGIRVHGAVAHGDELCYENRAKRELRFENSEIFAECPRPEIGVPRRTVRHGIREVEIIPLPLAAFGLQYESNRLPRGAYLSDSGGSWTSSFGDAVRAVGHSQLHLLVHPDWWTDAFSREGSNE